MAGELASAIAKTGQPRNRPQSVGVSEAALDNAFNGRRRADEAKAAKEAADREKRLDKINENTIFDTKFDNPYYQRQWQQDVNKAQDEILQATLTGDGNSAAIAGQAIRKLRALEGHYDGLNKNMNEAKKLYYEKPNQYQGFSDPQTINGVTYDTMWDALNDPATNGREAEVQKAFNSPFSNIAEEDVTGEKKFSVRFNPGAAFARSPEEAMKDRISNPDIYTRRGEAVEKSYLGARKRMTPMQMDEKAADEITVDAYVLPDVNSYAYQQDYKQRKAKANGKWTWAEQIATVSSQEVSEYASMNTAYELKQRANKWEEISAPAPQAPKLTPSQKRADEVMGMGSYDPVSKIWSVPTSENAQEESNRKFFNGTTVWVNGKQTHKINGPLQVASTPSGFYWGGSPSTSYFEYESERPPMGARDKDQTSNYTYRAPLSPEAAAQYAASQNMKWNDLAPALFEGMNPNEIEATRDFLMTLGGDGKLAGGGKQPTATPTAKPAANSKTVNLQELPVGAKIETKNGKNYYNGKEIIM
jgi:hypothetical protein